MSHFSLARIFDEIDKTNTNKTDSPYRARIGSQLSLLDKQTSSLLEVTLTRPNNSAPTFGKISHDSLLGLELLGVLPGQHVSVDVLGRNVKYQVLSVNNAQPTQRR